MIRIKNTWLFSILAAALCGLLVSCAAAPVAQEETTQAQQQTTEAPDEVLPGIAAVEPTGLVIAPDSSGGGFLLSFDSAFENVGEGPLKIEGERQEASGPMVADQVIDRSDGTTRLREDVGKLQFTVSEDHRHWHFFRFMRYELVGASDGELVAPDQKTGFCVGDRYDADPETRLPGEPEPPGAFDVPPDGTWCERDETDILQIKMGLSVGYGDDYEAFLEGQSIDITDVPDGRYTLVHRVNADVKESDYTNNASSVLLELERPDGPDSQPDFTALARCPDSERCEQ